MRLPALALAAALSPVIVAAQGPPPFKPSSNPVTDAGRSMVGRFTKYLTASAELMPQEKYAYQPTPAQMTFGALMAHIVQTNMAICSTLTESPSPVSPQELGKIDASGGKTVLVPLVKQSFDYCAQALANATDSELGEEGTMFGRPIGMSRGMALVTIAVDWADHYSTAASYLRMNGILPPSAPAAKPPSS